MKFYIENGVRSAIDKEIIGVLTKHFYKVYNRKTIVDWEFINKIPIHLTVYNIAGLIMLDELNLAINKLVWHKAPSRNGVTPNIIKALNHNNCITLLKFIHTWMDNPNI